MCAATRTIACRSRHDARLRTSRGGISEAIVASEPEHSLPWFNAWQSLTERQRPRIHARPRQLAATSRCLSNRLECAQRAYGARRAPVRFRFRSGCSSGRGLRLRSEVHGWLKRPAASASCCRIASFSSRRDYGPNEIGEPAPHDAHPNAQKDERGEAEEDGGQQ